MLNKMWCFLKVDIQYTWVLLLTFSVLENIVMFSEDGHTAPEYYYLLSLYWRTLWCFLKMDIQRQHFSPYSLSSSMYWLPRFSTHLPFPEMVELRMMRGWEYPRWKYSPCQVAGISHPPPGKVEVTTMCCTLFSDKMAFKKLKNEWH